MERKTFIRNCCLACMGGAFFSAFLESCGETRMITGTLDANGLSVPLHDFQEKNGTFKKYIVAQHEQLKYPICIYRFSERDYCALLMRCTHQGAELQVFGDKLECPAHGSTFSDRGSVINGPADTSLRTFPVTIKADQLCISLK